VSKQCRCCEGRSSRTIFLFSTTCPDLPKTGHAPLDVWPSRYPPSSHQKTLLEIIDAYATNRMRITDHELLVWANGRWTKRPNLPAEASPHENHRGCRWPYAVRAIVLLSSGGRSERQQRNPTGLPTLWEKAKLACRHLFSSLDDLVFETGTRTALTSGFGPPTRPSLQRPGANCSAGHSQDPQL